MLFVSLPMSEWSRYPRGCVAKKYFRFDTVPYKEAFRRALPGFLTRPRLRSKWAAFHGDEQVGLAPKPEALIGECVRRGLAHDQYYVGCIRPQAVEPEEVDPSFFEYEDFSPHS